MVRTWKSTQLAINVLHGKLPAEHRISLQAIGCGGYTCFERCLWIMHSLLMVIDAYG